MATDTEDYLAIKYGLTRRRVKYSVRILGYVIGISVGFVIAIEAILYGFATISNWFSSEVKSSAINYTEFLTAVVASWAAEVPILILTGIFLHWILKESRSPVAEVENTDTDTRTDASGTKTLAMVVENSGEVAAHDCQARLVLYDVKPGDIIQTSQSMAKIPPDTFKLPLKLNLMWASGSKEVTIRSGDDAKADILRIVPDNEKKVHFEVPSETGWTQVSCALKPDWYHGWFRVVPLNGKPASSRFVLQYNKEYGWHIEFL
jgi:hypothetical protein